MEQAVSAPGAYFEKALSPGSSRALRFSSGVGAEQNTTTTIMMPSEFVEMARTIGARGGEKKKT
ncbi:MAG: hypothetical protein WA733_22430 [Methylocystis sp.]